MSILHTEPMRIHKNLIIRALEAHPEDFEQVFPDGRFKTAEEAIAALKAHPAEWVVNGVLKADTEGEK